MSCRRRHSARRRDQLTEIVTGATRFTIQGGDGDDLIDDGPGNNSIR
jgi:hypothetical protein